MKFVTYNIQSGRGKDERVDLARIVAEIEGADVVALQEVDCGWRRSGGVDQPRALAELMDGYHWAYGPGVDFDASHREADGSLVRARRRFGNVLLTRMPMLQVRHHPLPKYATLGDPVSLQRSALEAVIECPGGRLLRIYSVHLTHLSAATRMPQVERLLDIHARAPLEGPAVTGGGADLEGAPFAAMPREAVLMGDFNFTPDAREYERIVGPDSPYGGRMVNPEGLVDAWVVAGRAGEAETTATFRGEAVRFDYFFASTALAHTLRAVSVDQGARGSDHQPVWMECAL